MFLSIPALQTCNVSLLWVQHMMNMIFSIMFVDTMSCMWLVGSQRLVCLLVWENNKWSTRCHLPQWNWTVLCDSYFSEAFFSYSCWLMENILLSGLDYLLFSLCHFNRNHCLHNNAFSHWKSSFVCLQFFFYMSHSILKIFVKQLKQTFELPDILLRPTGLFCFWEKQMWTPCSCFSILRITVCWDLKDVIYPNCQKMALRVLYWNTFHLWIQLLEFQGGD